MRIKIEITGVDPVLLKGQIAVLCELPGLLRVHADDENDNDSDRLYYLVLAEAVDGVVEMLGARVESTLGGETL